MKFTMCVFLLLTLLTLLATKKVVFRFWFKSMKGV